MERKTRALLTIISLLFLNGCSEKKEFVLQKTETLPAENILQETIPMVVMLPHEKPADMIQSQEIPVYETRLVSEKIPSRSIETHEKIISDTDLTERISNKKKTDDSKKPIQQKQNIWIESDSSENKNLNISPYLVNGECLIYRIKWNFASVGKFILVCKKEKINKRDVYHIVGLTVPEGIWTRIGNGYNRFDSYIDSENNLPFYYYSYSASPSTNQITKTIIDHNTKTLTYEVTKFREGKQYGCKSGKIKFSDTLYDGLSSIYILRGMVQEEMQLSQLTVGITKIINISLSLLKKDMDRFAIGEKHYFLIQSEATGEESIFQKGKLFVSISADNEKLPLLLRGKVPLGTATVELVTKKILNQNFPTDSKFLTEILNSTT